MKTQWPFADAPNTAAITTVNVLDRRSPILLVTHDSDDGSWQFLCGSTNDPSDGRVVGLASIVELDATVTELADLPLGWRAWRDSPQLPWNREARGDEV
jgi:hypothetical protein